MFYFVTYLYEGNISVFENKQVGELKGNKPAPEKKKKIKRNCVECGTLYARSISLFQVCFRMRFSLFQEYLKRKNKIRSGVKGDDVK